MNEITLPYHLLIPIIISILVLGIIFLKRKRLFGNEKLKWFWISLTVFFLFYLLIVGGATYSDLYAQWNLNKFDLNKDGFFNGKEMTLEQKEAMRNMTSDTGRNFSFITGIIFSGIIAFFLFIIGKVTELMKKKKMYIPFLTLSLIFFSCNECDLGNGYYFLPKYEAIDVGYPEGEAIIYKSNQEYSYSDIIIDGDVIDAKADSKFIIAKQDPLIDWKRNEGILKYFIILKKNDSLIGPLNIEKFELNVKKLDIKLEFE